MRNLIIGAAVIVGLGVVGGFMNQSREQNSACAESQYTDFVRSDMIDGPANKGYLNQSIYYGALTAAVESERLQASARSALEAELAEVEDAILNAPIKAREVSPSSSTELTCRYELQIGKTLVIARFPLVISEIAGTEFEKSFNKRQKSVILLEELQPGVPVEKVRIAKLGLRQVRVEEPLFTEGRFDLSFTPETLIRSGVISDIPK